MYKNLKFLYNKCLQADHGLQLNFVLHTTSIKLIKEWTSCCNLMDYRIIKRKAVTSGDKGQQVGKKQLEKL